MKGLIVSILRNVELGDCTNGGMSSKVKRAVITGDDIPEIFEPSENMPELKLVYRSNLNYYHAEPTNGKIDNCIGWMAGGNFCYTSDSRLRAICAYPIPIHDRQETQVQYDALSL